MAKDTITINAQSLESIKKYFLKNKFVLVFNLLALISIIIWLLNILELSSKMGFLTSIVTLFSSGLWLFSGIVFIVSGVLAYFEKWKLMFLPIILWLLITTAIVRTSNIPNLVNAATGEPVLGPDLDPFLFLRNAYEIVEGKNIGKTDMMRYAPLGTSSYIHSSLMPWAIVGIYKSMNLFGEYSVTQAGIIAPVIFFLISIVGFFFFVYVLFSFKLSEKKALIGAILASFLYAFVPTMLHRTAAGIPELESLGMVWFWFAFLFFALAWKSHLNSEGKDKKKAKRKIILYGLLAGLFTGAMSWTWGGYRYIYMVIGLASFLAFLFNIGKKKNFAILGSFLITGIIIEIAKFQNILTVINSFNDVGFALGIFLILGMDLLLFETKLK
ncbi:hypothetical protein FJZ20_01510, partial [Candidatus Pacearchaeota archaeon]|nr:hypothetical protein [Candidatus Pacearchaeota archaeon]